MALPIFRYKGRWRARPCLNPRKLKFPVVAAGIGAKPSAFYKSLRCRCGLPVAGIGRAGLPVLERNGSGAEEWSE